MPIALFLLILGLSGCSSKTHRERLEERQAGANPRAAAYAAEGFTMDHRSPEPRPYKAWEFFYKECALVSRNPFPNHAEYECTDPH